MFSKRVTIYVYELLIILNLTLYYLRNGTLLMTVRDNLRSMSLIVLRETHAALNLNAESFHLPPVKGNGRITLNFSLGLLFIYTINRTNITSVMLENISIADPEIQKIPYRVSYVRFLFFMLFKSAN